MPAASVSALSTDVCRAHATGSAEEVKDVCTAYLESKGDMGAIIDSVYCATPDDEDRFRAILEPRIADGTLEAFKRFTHESAAQRARRRKAQDREARQAEKALRELKQSEQCELFPSLAPPRCAAR